MKCLWFSILFVLPLMLASQTSSDSILVSKKTLIDAANRIVSLESKVDTAQQVNDNLTKQIDALTRLNDYNETIIGYRDKELEIYKSAVNRFVDFPAKTKEKWYETKQFNFIAGAVIGAVTIFSGAYVVSIIR